MKGSADSPALPALTGVRFVFSLGVVLFHLQLIWAWPTTEYTSLIERARLGVDMFFILSGFVLSYVYAQQVAEGRYSHTRFLAARVARIFPAHLVILAGMGVVGLVALMMGEPFNAEDYTLLGFFQSAVLVQAWFPSDGEVAWNGPSWSLSAEWGAYLIYPAFAVIGVRLKDRPILLVGLAVAVFAGLAAVYHALFGRLLLHAEENLGILRIVPTFLAGVALHVASQHIRLTRTASVLVGVGAAIFLGVVMHLGAPEAMVVAGGGALILALALMSKAGADGPLGWSWVVFWGEASFAIYLLHLPLLTVWRNARALLLGGSSSYVLATWEVACLLALILLGGAFVHVAIERPSRVWLRRRLTAADAR